MEEGGVQEVTVIGLQELGMEQQLEAGLEQLVGFGVGLEQAQELGHGWGPLWEAGQ